MFERMALVIICYAFPLALLAQPAIDSIKNSLDKKPELYGKFGTRNSFIDNSRTEVLGVSLGLDYNDRIRFAIGYNTLYSSAPLFDNQIQILNFSKKLIDSTRAKLQLNYGSLQAEYVYYNINKWKFSLPIQFGFGQIFYEYKYQNRTERINKQFAFAYEPGVSVEYKLWWWLGLGADVGFRFVVTNYKRFNEKINSPTYAFKAFVYYEEIYRRFFSKRK